MAQGTVKIWKKIFINSDTEVKAKNIYEEIASFTIQEICTKTVDIQIIELK